MQVRAFERYIPLSDGEENINNFTPKVFVYMEAYIINQF